MPEWTNAQEKAIELSDKLILVSAAAGSGKTSVLTERVIRKILKPGSDVKLTDLLIVTFTRSAAADLKRKIAEAIEAKLATNDLDKGTKERLRDQLLQIGSAQISTIDSFYLQIVRAHFEELGLPSNFRLADQNELRVLSEEILDDLIPEFYKQYEPGDHNSDNPFETVRNNLFADCVDHIFDGTSSSDLNGTFLKFYESFARVKGGINALRTSADILRSEAKLPFLQTHFGKLFLSHFEPFIRSFYELLEEVKTHHQAEIDTKRIASQSGILADDQLHCEAVLFALQKKDLDLLQNALTGFVFNTFRGVKGNPEWSLQYQHARDEFKKKLGKYTVLANAITPVEQEKAFLKTSDFAEMLYLFYSEFQNRYQAKKASLGIQDFNDVRDALYQLLNDPQNELLVKSIRETYKEVYIDEYQDVDEIQDEIFAKIGGQNRFMVGDIKQSIYGFRGSDPSVFAGYRNTMPLASSPEVEGSGSACVFMSENFRCERPIIDLTNAVCPLLFSASPESIHYLPEDDLKYSKPPLKEKQIGPAPSPVRIRIFEKPPTKSKTGAPEDDVEEEKTSTAERAWVAKEIARILHEEKKKDGTSVKPSDIAVLARKKAPLLLLQKELESYGVPTVNVAGNPLSRSPLFIDLLNLLRIVDNPYRDLPLSEYLLSDFGGFTLEEVRLLRTAFSIEKSLYDAITTAAESDHPLAAKASGFVKWLDYYRSIAAVQSADHFLRILFQDQKFSPYVFSPEFLTVYEQARIYQHTSWSGLYGFLNALERLVKAEKLESGFRKSENAVNLMTIHASKGLEYPVVFLVDCGRSIQSDSHKSRLIYRKGIGFASNLYGEESELSAPSFLKTIADITAKDAEIEEEIRLLYVAVTRARETLYLTGTPTRKIDNFTADASLIHRDDRYSILSAKSYLDWIYGALHRKDAKIANLDYQMISLLQSESEARSEQNMPEKVESKILTENAPDILHYRAVLEQSKTFAYPLSALQGIPTKAAASKLKADLLDILKGNDQIAAVTERISLMRGEQPDFQGLMDAQKRPTAAQIGSATHTILALCDLSALSPDTVESEVARLVDQKFLSEETAKIANLRVLKRFAASQLLERIKAAKEIYREKQFSLFIPLSELTKDRELAAALSGQELFVQGSIDLLLVTKDGRIELYDYKTDRITENEQNDPALLREHLKERHGNQLQIYARAVEELFGKCPDRISIFALSIGEIVNLC